MRELGRAVMTGAAALTVLLVGSVCTQQKGTFTDSRDGQKYKTVKIGNQTWMAENLRFNVGNSWCYENSVDSCKKYGRLYDWNMAKIACPKGWHLPSNDEWTELATVIGSSVAGKKLKSTHGWKSFDTVNTANGTDDFGFSALPTGHRNWHTPTKGSFVGVGYYCDWWTATDILGELVYLRGVRYDEDRLGEDAQKPIVGLPIRCVADT
jgi:uncharacterized protein (TIGR02145 family)